MILRELYDYAMEIADQLPPDGMELKEIEFVIVISKNGDFRRIESKRIDKTHCGQFCVAKSVIRTSSPKANTLWDNAKFVLGIGDTDGEYSRLFTERIRELSSLNPDDTSLTALVQFYDLPSEKRMDVMSADPLYEDMLNKSGANISFRIEGDNCLIAENSESLVGFERADENVIEGRCLVTGKHSRLVRTITPTPLPDNSPMAALVSFQKHSGYDSYGKSQAYNYGAQNEALHEEVGRF